MRRHVDVYPSHIQPWTIVNSDGTQEGCEISNAVSRDGKEEDVADNTKNIREKNKPEPKKKVLSRR
jgi:hypothetical protein